MRKFHEWNKNYEMLSRMMIIFLNCIISAIGMNFFLIPANVFSAGVNGLSQIVVGIVQMSFGYSIDTGILIFIFNIPIFLLGWWKLGPKSTIYSFFTVLCFSVVSFFMPIELIVDDTMMNAIIGGVLIGIGSAFCLKFGFTTGGFDLLSVVIAKSTGKSVGNMMLVMNSVIVLGAGLLYNWEQAIYTIISIYALSIVVDRIHTSGHKLTLFIVTKNEQTVLDSLHKTIVRGVTVLPALGGMSKEKSTVLMVVINRYELYDVEKAIYNVDEKAFVNVLPTEHVMGVFFTEEQQREAIRLAYGQTE